MVPVASFRLYTRVPFIGNAQLKTQPKSGARLLKCLSSIKSGASVVSWVSNA